jgi:preprotein translocase subunit YajC|tara:strand:- start:38 stop:190 length:153 start_codon:yes stop_codon:yes gene_type:complete
MFSVQGLVLAFLSGIMFMALIFGMWLYFMERRIEKEQGLSDELMSWLKDL